MSSQRVTVSLQWTETARQGLAKLPVKARRGLLEKADELAACTDPRSASKPLVGPLQGYYRITYARYRAIYSVQEEISGHGQIHLRITIRFVAAGIRKEGDKRDIYRFALRLMQLGILDRPPRKGKPPQA